MSKLNGETAAVLTNPSVALHFVSRGAVAIAQVHLFAGNVLVAGGPLFLPTLR